jgi:hypothetical protein
MAKISVYIFFFLVVHTHHESRVRHARLSIKRRRKEVVSTYNHIAKTLSLLDEFPTDLVTIHLRSGFRTDIWLIPEACGNWKHGLELNNADGKEWSRYNSEFTYDY